jgi:hypothetical protein
MKIILPYVNGMLYDETNAFGETVGATFVRITEKQTYFDLLERLWNKGDPFLVIEHDIVGSVEDVEAMKRCKSPYCVAPYLGPSNTLLTKSLGFTRFRPLMLRRDLFNAIRENKDTEPFDYDDWRRIDCRITQVLGVEAHLHAHVEHLHVY